MRTGILWAVFGVLACLVTPVRSEPATGKGPQITVVDSPVAARWLSHAGVSYTTRSGSDLGSTPLANVDLLVLPMEAVQTTGATTVVSDYIATGGRVLAIYWGTLSVDGAEPMSNFRLAELLGVRPVGWTLNPPQPLVLKDPGSGALPSAGDRISLPNCPTTVMEALPGTQVVARWGEEGDSALPSARAGAVFLQGNALYLGANILRPASDRPDNRELFFWAVQRVAPEFGPVLQAKDRIAAAAAMRARLTGVLGGDMSPDLRAGAELVRTLLGEARTLLTTGHAVKACASADKSRSLASHLIDRIRADREPNQ